MQHLSLVNAIIIHTAAQLHCYLLIYLHNSALTHKAKCLDTRLKWSLPLLEWRSVRHDIIVSNIKFTDFSEPDNYLVKHLSRVFTATNKMNKITTTITPYIKCYNITETR